MRALALSASSAAFLALFAPTDAQAGAWIAPAEGQEIWTDVAGERDGFEYLETSAYWEIPVFDDDSVVIAPWVEQSPDASDEGWKAESVVGLKHAIVRTDHAAIALQAGAVWDSQPQAHCGEAAAELRWLGGVILDIPISSISKRPRAKAATRVKTRGSISPQAIGRGRIGSAWRNSTTTRPHTATRRSNSNSHSFASTEKTPAKGCKLACARASTAATQSLL